MILEKARELGLALSETIEYRQMMEARTAMDANGAVCTLLQEFQDKQQELMEVLTQGDADRLQIAALSRDVEMLQESLTQNELFTEAVKAQNAFSVLMREVNGEIAACIGLPAQGGSSCGGSCEGCQGCGH